jgi:hypothetical protein
MADILKKFPKQRIALPEEYRKIYNSHYLNNREGKYKTTSLSQKLESWMHRKVAEDLKYVGSQTDTLEIGAGTLNQLGYEPHVKNYDIVEPFKELFENSELKGRIKHIYNDISEIPPDRKYDRITSIATFEHIMDLPFVVAEAALHLSDKGHLRCAIPNEGTIMWKLGTMITGAEFKKRYGLDYQVLMRFEHVNTADDIEMVLRHFFKELKCSVFGISRQLAFYRFYDCSSPDRDAVAKYFSARDNALKI